MAFSGRDNISYEQLRHVDVPVAAPYPIRKSHSYSREDSGQAPYDRPALGTPSANRPPSAHQNFPSLTLNMPSSMAGSRAPGGPSFEDREALASLEARSPGGRGRPTVRPGRTNSMNTSVTAHSHTLTPQMAEDSDNDHGGAYFDQNRGEPAGPSANQFLAARGRPMSFYDMKEQGRQAKLGPNPMQAQHNRTSWRSGEMPFNYADIIGDNRNSYVPPNMGTHSGGQNQPSNNHENYFPTRLPWTMWMNSEAKNHFVAALSEWVGTTMFLFFAFAGTQVANAQTKTPAEATTTNATVGFDPVVMLYISVSFGFSLMVNVWVFFRISGGLFNPAVTLALWATRAIGATRAVILFLSQIVGSITASALIVAIFPTPFSVRTTLSDGTSIAQGLFIEAFMTAELVFTILMLAKEKHRSTFIAPVGIGLALFIAELVGVYYTGGSLNPARSIGPCIVAGKFDVEHWIYWVGPGIGSVFAIAFYLFIKVLEYEMANPGQDGDDENDPTRNPNHELREKQREMTTRILSQLGYENPVAASEAAQRSAEEGAYFTSRTSSVMNDSDHEQRFNANNVALSTVASMSDHIGSPPPTSHHQHSPSLTGDR